MIKHINRIKKNYGNKALITGASAGIGKSFAYILASYGFDLVITARRIERLNSIKAELEKDFNVSVTCIEANLSDKSGIRNIVELMKIYNPGILVSNAGFGNLGPLSGNDVSLIENMIKVNCLSASLLINTFAGIERDSKRKAIINISSVMAKLPLSFASLYAATKGFNSAFGEALYHELKQESIDILTVLPGSTSTEFNGFGNNIPGSKQRKPEQVVTTSLKALGKKPVVVDGFGNRLNVLLSRIVPTSSRIYFTGKVAGWQYKKVKNQL